MRIATIASFVITTLLGIVALLAVPAYASPAIDSSPAHAVIYPDDSTETSGCTTIIAKIFDVNVAGTYSVSDDHGNVMTEYIDKGQQFQFNIKYTDHPSGSSTFTAALGKPGDAHYVVLAASKVFNCLAAG